MGNTSGYDLSGRTAVVTGAASGMGEATARLLAAGGARVALLARRTERLDQLERGQTAAKAAIVEQERRPASSRAPLWIAVAAAVLAAAALVLVLVLLSP